MSTTFATGHFGASEAAGGPGRIRFAPAMLRSASGLTASDGVKIPVSLVYRRDSFTRRLDQSFYVYGYGSYGYPLPIGFSPSRLSLLDRGVVLAYAHIRGGGEMGDSWHDAGKMMVKRNTFTDFIAVTEQSGRQRVRRQRPRRHRRWQRRRAADGSGRQRAARPVPRSPVACSLCGCDEHDARRQPAADRRRVRGVGQSERARGLRTTCGPIPRTTT